MQMALRAVPAVQGYALAIAGVACALALGIVVWLAMSLHPVWSALALLPITSLWRQAALAGARDTPPGLAPDGTEHGRITGGFVIAGMAYVKTLGATGSRSWLVSSGAVGQSGCRRLRVVLRHRSEA
ncbi:MAG: hypothetical protein ACKVQQ_25040 [Burkholderiales bacterium]